MDRATNRTYASLEEALRDKHYPEENDELIARYTDAIGIEAFVSMSDHIKAVRRDGGEPLRIYYGGTNGFASEEEVVHSCGNVRRGPSKNRPGLWRIDHPIFIDGVGRFGGVRPKPGAYGMCPECFIERSASGTCACTQ